MDLVRKKASKGVGLGGKNKELKHENLDQEVLECVKKKDLSKLYPQWLKSTDKAVDEFKKDFPLKHKDNVTERERLVLELLATEQTYHQGLVVLVECFKRPLCLISKHSKAVEYDSIEKLFLKVEEIRDRSRIFLQRLLDRVESWLEPNQDRIGDIFRLVSGFVNDYSVFSSYFQEGQVFLGDMKAKSPDFKLFFDQLELNAVSSYNFKFDNLYITPVQRIPRYVMLIRDLLKNTASRHVDFEELSSVGSIVDTVARDINLAISKNEREKKYDVLEKTNHNLKRVMTEVPMFSSKESAVKRLFLNSFEIRFIYDVKTKKVDKAENNQLALFTDILVVTAFLNKKNELSEVYIPVKIMWLKENITAEEKGLLGPHLEGQESELLASFVGPEQHWIVGFKTLAFKALALNEIVQEMGVYVRALEEAGVGVRRGGHRFAGIKGDYVGEWLNGRPHGRGRLESHVPESRYYKGNWSGPLAVGYGKIGEGTNSRESGWKVLDDKVVANDKYHFWDQNGLTEHDWKVLLTNCSPSKVKAGTLIIEKGKPAELCRIMVGRVEVIIDEKDESKNKEIRPTGSGNNEEQFLGVTALLPGQVASVSIRAKTEVEFVKVNTELLMSILSTEPGISKRLYCFLAERLASKLIEITKTKTDPSESDNFGGQIKTMTTEEAEMEEFIRVISSTGIITKKTKKNQERLAQMNKSHKKDHVIDNSNELEEEMKIRFGIDRSETFLQHSPCHMVKTDKGPIKGLKSTGTLYVFSGTVVFESVIFTSRKRLVFPLETISSIELSTETYSKEKVLSFLLTSGSMKKFGGLHDQEGMYSIISSLKKDTPLSPRPSRQNLSDSGSVRSSSSRNTGEPRLVSSKSVTTIPQREGDQVNLMMNADDWALLLDKKSRGFEIVTFKKNEYIVREGQKHHRIYQLFSGSCRVEKLLENHETKLLTTLYPKPAPDAEVFGELTFIDSKNQRATASVVADSDETVITILEGWFINALMVDYPLLGGKIYRYFCNILITRIAEREEAMRNKQSVSPEKEKREKEKVETKETPRDLTDSASSSHRRSKSKKTIEGSRRIKLDNGS